MYCQNRIVHVVEEGDSLYKISRRYGATVDELIMGNPGVNPYNLQIGMRLYVCPGESYHAEVTPGGTSKEEENTKKDTEENMQSSTLKEEMRLAWLSHVYWTRMLLMAVDADSPDQKQTGARAVQTADEIADVFAKVLPQNVTRQLRNLLTEHVELTGEVMQSMKADSMPNIDELIRAWYKNANQIANLLAGANPYFAGKETRNMLLNHLDLTREEIEQQINGEYAQSIDTFGEIVKQAVDMADHFAMGLLAR
jgi:spore germination protein YaaH